MSTRLMTPSNVSQIKRKFERLTVLESLTGTETLHFRELMYVVSKQFHFDHCKGAVRRYPDKGACAFKWGAPLCGVIG